MLYLYKLCKDNNISNLAIASLLNIKCRQANKKLNNDCQFTIQELYILKDYFTNKHILLDNFDIGTFLNDV